MIAPRFRASLLLAAVFIAGLLAGAGGVALAWRRPPMGPPPSPQAIARRLGAHLDLTPVQRAAVARVLDEGRPAADSLWAACGPGMRALRDATNDRIAALLTPSQRAEFARLRARAERGAPPAAPP